MWLAFRFPDLVGKLADSFLVGTHLDTPGITRFV
jgi:hypothetical protein